MFNHLTFRKILGGIVTDSDLYNHGNKVTDKQVSQDPDYSVRATLCAPSLEENHHDQRIINTCTDLNSIQKTFN